MLQVMAPRHRHRRACCAGIWRCAHWQAGAVEGVAQRLPQPCPAIPWLLICLHVTHHLADNSAISPTMELLRQKTLRREPMLCQ